MAVDPNALSELSRDVRQAHRQFAVLNAAMGSFKGAVTGVASLVGGPIVGQIASTLTDLPGMLKGAVLSVKDAFDSVVSAVKPFVEAFSPSTVQAFNAAMRDTNAVIGYALLPVMQSAVQVVRQFGDAILPAMRKIEPAAREAADVFTNALAPFMTSLGGAARGLADAFAGLLDEVRPFTPELLELRDAFVAWAALFQAVSAQYFTAAVEATKALGRMLGLVGAQETLSSSMRRLATNVLLASASLAKLFGMDTFVRQLRAAMGEGQNKGGSIGMAAATNAQITTAPEWAKSLALAAFTASGQAGGQSAQEVWQNAVLAALQQVDTMDMKAELVKKLEEVKAGLITELSKLPAAIAEQLLAQTKQTLRLPANPLIPQPRLPWG